MKMKLPSLFRSKMFWVIVILAVVVRVVGPLVVRQQLNKFLADFSPIYSGHIDDVSLGVLRGAYQFRGFELRLKDPKTDRFVYGKLVDVSLAWRELFKGRITTDIAVEGVDVILTNNVMNAIANAPKSAKDDTKEAANKLFPVRIERVDIRNSGFEFAELISIPDSKRWKITGIEGRISNVTPTEGVPLMFVTASGSLFDNAKLKIAAQVNQQIKPLAWDVDAELREFDLVEANAYLKRKLPLTFTSGKLDLFAEARSLDGGMEGYVKPFLKRADVVANRESFEGLKHFGIEISTATANLILRSSKEKTLATKVLFNYQNGEFKLNSAKAIGEAFKNGFRETLADGIDDEMSLAKKAQEPSSSIRQEKP